MKVFISHSPRGAALAQAVAVGLRREGLETWLPVDEVMPGDNWAERVSSALAECEAMVVLLTPDTATADNVQWEMSFALGNKGGGRIGADIAAGLQEDPVMAHDVLRHVAQVLELDMNGLTGLNLDPHHTESQRVAGSDHNCRFVVRCRCRRRESRRDQGAKEKSGEMSVFHGKAG